MSTTLRHPRLALRPGAHRRLKSGHPWIYSNEVALDAAAKSLAPGSVVTITDAGGSLLATAHFNAHTLIAARVLAGAGDVAVTVQFYADRIDRALSLRRRLFARPFYRLVHAEADGLPGLVIDRFDDVCVVQPNTAGMQAALSEITEALIKVLNPRAIVMRGDSAARGLEGLDEDVRLIAGTLTGPVAVEENGAVFRADVLSGQKTGWFFDQRDNRAFMAGLSKDATVLDLYTHTGGFAIAAARAGATTVTAVDRSQSALDLAAQAAPLNNVADRVAFERSDVFGFLEAATTRGQTWQMVIADPPPFVKSRKDLKAGLQGYRKLARLCGQVAAPGGLLLVASCSHNAPVDEFTAAVVRGLGDAGRSGPIIRTAGAGPDHPIHPLLPESAYLKAVVLALD
ncbi:MAG: class I SAM-dependent rRNA methyltransferase [Rhodospirillaceae bacterium]|nr:MAG: class I SAM-dependent rRNA methyltransferase [Rhodospirillaceae bacterium]